MLGPRALFADLDFALNSEHAADLIGQCPHYRPAPLMQAEIAGRAIWLKHENNRLGLRSFTALGGVYAIADFVRRVGAHAVATAPPSDPGLRDFAAHMRFVCASAGNYGLSVAGGANLFGAEARVRLPASAPGAFMSRIRALGADAVSSGENFDEVMRAARADAARCGAICLFDCAFSDHEIGPALVMESYTLIGLEMAGVFADSGRGPKYLFVQACVGGLAAALAFHIRSIWPEQKEIIVVEPETAACVAADVTQSHVVQTSPPRA